MNSLTGITKNDNINSQNIHKFVNNKQVIAYIFVTNTYYIVYFRLSKKIEPVTMSLKVN